MNDTSKIISRMSAFSQDAENIFCFNDYKSSGKPVIDLLIGLNCAKAYMLVIEDEGTATLFDGDQVIVQRSEHFIDCLPILFKSAEPSRMTSEELSLFLEQVSQKSTYSEKSFGAYFGLEVTQTKCVFFVCIYDSVEAVEDQCIEFGNCSLKDNLMDLYYLIDSTVSSLVHKKEGVSLKKQLESNRQQQSIWLESLDWLIKASSQLEETDYDSFYSEAIFQLSRLLKTDDSLIFKKDEQNNKIKLLNGLAESEFSLHVKELVQQDITLKKGSFTEFHHFKSDLQNITHFKHILVFPIYFDQDLRLLVAIGKKDSDFDSNEVVFSGLFCDGIQNAVERRNFIKSIRLQNEKLTKEKEEQKALILKLHETQDQLFQQEKMASIGQLAAGVAHEINNPVGYVSSNIASLEHYVEDILGVFDFLDEIILEKPDYDLLKEKVSTLKDELDIEFIKEDCYTLLSESKEGIVRVKEIVQDLKDFSHVDEATWQEADLVRGIESTLNIVSNDLKYKAKINKEYGELPLVTCVPPQINQVIMNLLVNAGHAISERGEITIRTYSIDKEKVAIEIEDTGSGISEENLNKIFDPFFTTKPVGTGTGLGLSLSYSIIEKHGGQLKCKSTVGVGTTFTIILPITRLKSEDETKLLVSGS